MHLLCQMFYLLSRDNYHQIKLVNEYLVTALDNHDDEIRDHAGVYESEQHDHQGFHVPSELMPDKTIVIYEERKHVQRQGKDERDVDRVENPTNRKEKGPGPLRPELRVFHGWSRPLLLDRRY